MVARIKTKKMRRKIFVKCLSFQNFLNFFQTRWSFSFICKDWMYSFAFKNILEFFMFCIILEFFMLCIFSFKFFIFPRPRKNCGLGKTEYGREHRRDKCSAKIS